jgi:hypothetical protein
MPVHNCNGQVIRGARVERSGVTFIRFNPIRRMVARGQGKEAPLLTKRHADAADRLLAAWTEAGEGVSHGTASYNVKIVDPASSGMIADGVLRSIHRQIAARMEIDEIRAQLGVRWSVLYSVVIAGIEVSAWGAASGMNPSVAAGYLACAMDWLAHFYAPPEQVQRSRVVEFQSPGDLAAD